MSYKKLLKNNKNWVKNILSIDPKYFNKLKKGQNPKILMIGCSDSRVSLEKILGADLGELFIHRNIANQVNITDINFLSVLEYAVEHLHVKHIVVMGHYDCGGIKAAVTGEESSIAENWLMPIKDLYSTNYANLKRIKNKQDRLDKLSEINIIQQVKNIKKTSIYHRAIKNKTAPKLHGWIFNLYTGEIIELDV